jgi:hypothetical protein
MSLAIGALAASAALTIGGCGTTIQSATTAEFLLVAAVGGELAALGVA